MTQQTRIKKRMEAAKALRALCKEMIPPPKVIDSSIYVVLGAVVIALAVLLEELP